MSLNPYQSPEPHAPLGDSSQPNPELARQRLQPPAIILIVMAALTSILRVAGLALELMKLGAMDGQATDMGFVAGSIGGNGLALILNVATIIGAYKMMHLESFSAARAAAIISVIPICSPCLVFGIPFGIWALVVLHDPPVRACFKS